jgi:hypothetical protein
MTGSTPHQYALRTRRRVWAECRLKWGTSRAAAARLDFEKPAPHGGPRAWGRPCHVAGGALKHIPFLLGPVTIQTTALPRTQAEAAGCRVSDRLGINPMAVDPNHPQGGCFNPPLGDLRD